MVRGVRAARTHLHSFGDRQHDYMLRGYVFCFVCFLVKHFTDIFLEGFVGIAFFFFKNVPRSLLLQFYARTLATLLFAASLALSHAALHDQLDALIDYSTSCSYRSFCSFSCCFSLMHSRNACAAWRIKRYGRCSLCSFLLRSTQSASCRRRREARGRGSSSTASTFRPVRSSCEPSGVASRIW